MSNESRVPVIHNLRRASVVSDTNSSAPVPVRVPAIALLEKDSAFWRVVSNLAACISAPPRSVPAWGRKHSTMFRSAFLRKGDPSKGMLLSLLLHVIAVTTMISPPWFLAESAVLRLRPPETLIAKHQVIYYTKADLLPLISPPRPKAAAKRTPKPALSKAPVKFAIHPAQQIVSKSPVPDSRRQTIVQPDAPRIDLRAEIRVPNLIRWNAPDLPSPPVPTEIRRPVPKPAPELAKPKPPAPAAMPAIPTLTALKTDASAIPLAPVVTVNVPKLLVPVRIRPAAPPAPVVLATTAAVVREDPVMPAAAAVEMVANPSLLPNLVAISVAPAPPSEEVVIPSGSRAGEFAASPEGSGNESVGTPSANNAIASTTPGIGEVPGEEMAAIHLPGLSISGGRPTPAPSAINGRDPGGDLRRLMASISRPTLTPEVMKDRPMESEFFGARRVYTVVMNMPNLTSAAGSWVLRFAELDGRRDLPGSADELSTPEAIRKVDPMYVASAAREKVQGTVTLAALVLKDGTLANIRVVGSLDPRLDSSAVAALTQWQFSPARKGRQPVDLELLVQIPFRLTSF